MIKALGGLGLASAAGLNAYIPALAIAVLAQFTDRVHLPAELAFLDRTWVLVTLLLLLVVEEIVDKIPGADHLNDIVQTIVRPASGAVVFAAGAPDAFNGNVWVALAVGFVMALTVHGAKAAGRGVVNVSTAGVGAPVVSVVEDLLSIAATVVAIAIPALVVVVLLGVVWLVWVAIRRRTRRASQGRTGGNTVGA